ncbi:hypothetical protein HYALB_00003804 [Hymenoscyphus albidus]|uniref:Interferon-induced GTP-binding protein Mx n=1 Tax=Hymenoscyphus albidus TaxID=595503 RepID=A0A9N9LTG3_9HELO|nr:hypothetical protein HYALB_00003804 [Hymenoscyphus albidus]
MPELSSTGTDTPSTTPPILKTKTSLANLQSDEQRRVLDTIARVRKCGLEGTISLPQIVVCGDQSSGKSSVLEALTEIPFPRDELLCTRHATEIILSNAPEDSITIRVIPDQERPHAEKVRIGAFEKSIDSFDGLPEIMNEAMELMGIGVTDADTKAPPPTFSRDVLSIACEGPGRPQLALVDIPGLFGTENRGTTNQDIELVSQITDHYIKQSRTICLPVISGASDYANQSIPSRVKIEDPQGNRTLGIITKPDCSPEGSPLQDSFIQLAKNQDIKFRLGWHVVRNRKWEESGFNLAMRKAIEEEFFRTSKWKCVPQKSRGIDSLRNRLSKLLFQHVKNELPKLKQELEDKLGNAVEEHEKLGTPRSSSADCKAYLSNLSLEVRDTCKAAIDGHYEGDYFRDTDPDFNLSSASTIRRTRAAIQSSNIKFADTLRTRGHKYQIGMPQIAGDLSEDSNDGGSFGDSKVGGKKKSIQPLMMKEQALDWVRKAIIRNRGKELVGNFNPLTIGELFWELSENWQNLATAHVNDRADLCTRFLHNLIRDKCPKDVESRVWEFRMEGELRVRRQAALEELGKLMEDHRNCPINYNHYYTDNIVKRRQDRQRKELAKHVKEATTTATKTNGKNETTTHKVNIEQVVANYSKAVNPNMDTFSCEEALDCLFAIYKVSQKVFVTNVTVQVIERHLIKGLENIFSPVWVGGLEPLEAQRLASEPVGVKNKREHLAEKIEKLQEGQEIFRQVM